MSITFHPKVNELARSRQVAEQAENAFLTNWIISGLELSVPGSGRNVPVSSGKAFINGYIVDLVSMTLQVPDNATSTVYLGAHLDGQNNVNHFELSHDAPSSSYYVVLGQVVVSGGNITSVNETGRSVEDRLIRTANIQDSAITTGKINSSAVTTDKIANDAVTFDKTQNISSSRVLGRRSVGSGNIEEITYSDLKNDLNILTPPIKKIKLLDQSVNNSTILIDDTYLTVPIDSSTNYYFEAFLYIKKGSGDLKYRISSPSDLVTRMYSNDTPIVSTSTGSQFIDKPVLISTNEDIIKNTDGCIVINGYLKATTSGTLKIQFAQNTASSTTPAQILAGSSILLRQTSDNITFYKMQYLVIAGGGSVAQLYYAAGGGAGGYRTSATGQTSGGGNSTEPELNILQNDVITVTVGAGGSGGSSGSNSSLGSIVCIGGGSGGAYSSGSNGNTGGSGGGGGGPSTSGATSSGGSGTPNQGFKGGDGAFEIRSGSGGGAGAAGSTPTTNYGAASGGAGLSNDITGTAITRGVGGIGGGYRANAISGAANTGNGATPGWNIISSGGSGVVIIKYPNTLTCTVGAGLTSTETTSGGFKIRTFTAGTGTISLS